MNPSHAYRRRFVELPACCVAAFGLLNWAACLQPQRSAVAAIAQTATKPAKPDFTGPAAEPRWFTDQPPVGAIWLETLDLGLMDQGWGTPRAGRSVDDHSLTLHGTAYRAAVDWMVKSGLAAHGVHYINIDDAWEGQRDEKGRVQTNEKFPDMKALADYVHGKGLKLGIYSSPGPKTCAGYEGSYQHEQSDAARYAEWGIRDTKLTHNEQITHITLWSLLAAPLLIGCDLSQLDDFTMALLTNPEVLEVSQDLLGRQARRDSNQAAKNFVGPLGVMQ